MTTRYFKAKAGHNDTATISIWEIKGEVKKIFKDDNGSEFRDVQSNYNIGFDFLYEYYKERELLLPDICNQNPQLQ